MQKDKIKFSKVANFLQSRLHMNIYNDPYQQKYVEAMIAPTSEIQAVFLDAEAGTGKTSLAIAIAHYLLENDMIDQIVYIRSAVAIRELGFLPGDIAEKEAPYMQPGLDALSKIDKNNPKLIETLISNEKLIIATTAFLRGVDWDGRKFLIVDEAQNMNLQEMQMVLTRPHDSTKIVVVGSKLQCDEGDKMKRYGKENLLPFELYAIHYTRNSPLNVVYLTLKTNYRGKFSLFADKIAHTIKHLELDSSQRSNLTIPIEDSDEELSQAWEDVGQRVFAK